jgi:1-acyl-sn-glycerol-3-phosphate acyltransferase
VADSDRAGGAGVDGALRPAYADRGAHRTRTSLLGDLARRLSTLEQQVEDALTPGDARVGAGGPLWRTTLEDVLGIYARARRWSAEATPRELADLGLRALYRYWWRVEARGLERIPASGRVLVVANRSASLFPYEALMVGTALAIDHPAGRAARPLVDDWLAELPWVGAALAGLGALPATSVALRELLTRDQAAVVFPESREAVAKPFDRRYRLGPFGRGMLFRVAIETGTPIVPVAVIGAEEIQPVLIRLEALGQAFGIPAVPVTPTFPWLGLLGLVPLPTKWTLQVGDPLDVPSRYPADTARNQAFAASLREQVRERLQALVSEGLRRRRWIFLG